MQDCSKGNHRSMDIPGKDNSLNEQAGVLFWSEKQSKGHDSEYSIPWLSETSEASEEALGKVTSSPTTQQVPWRLRRKGQVAVSFMAKFSQT